MKTTILSITAWFATINRTDIAIVATALTTVSAVLEKLLKFKFAGYYAWKILKKIGAALSAPFFVPRRMSELEVQVAAIKKEVTHNGGMSMKDAVRQVQQAHQTTAAVMQEILVRMETADEWDSRMIFKMDREGKLTSVNRAFLRHFGWLERDMLGSNWENTVEPQEITQVLEKWQRAIETKSDFRDEYHVLTSDNDSERCLVQASPIIRSGELCGYYGTIELL